jgi:hypothetical protein
VLPLGLKDHDWVGFLRNEFPVDKLKNRQAGYLHQIYEVAENEQSSSHSTDTWAHSYIRHPRSESAKNAADQEESFTADNRRIPSGSRVGLYTTQSDQQDSGGKAKPPASTILSMARADPRSQIHRASSMSEQRIYGSEVMCSDPTSGLTRETKAGQPYLTDLLPNVYGASTGPSFSSEITTDAADKTTLNTFKSVPCGEGSDHCGPPQTSYSGMFLERLNTVQKPQYARTTALRYEDIPLRHHQGRLPTMGTGHQPLTNYRYGFMQFQPATLDYHNADFANMHQMMETTIWAQPVATVTNDDFHTMLDYSTMYGSCGPFEQRSEPVFTDTRCQTMHPQWF